MLRMRCLTNTNTLVCNYATFNSNIVTFINSRDTDVKFRNINQLCHREERFIAKRKTEVFKNMKKTKELEHNLQYEEDVSIDNK